MGFYRVGPRLTFVSYRLQVQQEEAHSKQGHSRAVELVLQNRIQQKRASSEKRRAPFAAERI